MTITDGDLIIARLQVQIDKLVERLALAEQALVDAEHHEYHLLAVVKAARRIAALQPCRLWVNGRCETHGEMKPCTVERLQKALARLDVTEQTGVTKACWS